VSVNQPQKTIELFGFSSFEEISNVEGFLSDNPLTQENYQQIIGWYDLPEQRSCCVQRATGTLYARLHNHGWVARLRDGSITILGGDCAKEKFGADSTVFKDIGLAQNVTKAKERERRITQLIAEGARYRAQLQESITQLKASHQAVDNYLRDIGDQFRGRIERMAKTGRADVVVEGEIVRHYEERGRPKQEISVTKHRLGSLDGLSAVSRSQFVTLIAEMEQIKLAFAELQQGEQLSRKNKSELSACVEQCEPVLARGRLLNETADRFIANSALLYCFLTDDRSERARLARRAMREAGIDGNKAQAKSWLTDRENQIRLEMRADRLRLAR
jgi:DNA-binding CsgD family transcriptional regulator